MKKTEKAAKQIIEEGTLKKVGAECIYHTAAITMMFLVSHAQPGYTI